MTLSASSPEVRPRRPIGWIPRPRVTEEIARALEPDSAIFVFGPAGSGKSLAVDELARCHGGLVRWLTAEAGPSDLADEARRAQSGDIVVVDGLDRCHRGAGDACIAALSCVHAGVSTLITSRFAPPSTMARDRLAGRVRLIDPGSLALDTSEAAELADTYGLDAADVARIHQDSAGWIAGFVLHARGRASTVDRDALDAYIRSEVLALLSPGLRFALASTASLDCVSERLLVEVAADPSVAAELLEVALPGASTAGGLRLAPCVRHLLAGTIDDPTARSACTRAAWRLRASGASADATDALVSAGHLVAAEAPAAEAAAGGADGDRVLGWLGVLDRGAARRRPPLREAQLRALHRRSDHGQVAEIARVMRASGELEALLARGEPAAAWAVASLVRQGYAADLLGLLEAAEPSIWAPAAWAVGVVCRPDPAPPPLDVDATAMLPIASVVAQALLWRGRRGDAMTLLDLAEPHDPDVALVRCHQLLALGEVEAARALAPTGRPAALTMLDCELAVASGDADEALRLLPSARAAAERTGDLVGARSDLAIVEGQTHWLRGEPRRAIPALEAARSWALRRGLRATVEWVDVWLAGALVAAGSAAAARPRLEQSLADMVRGERRLAHPLGLLVLAEAAWLQGDEQTHDAAVDDAVAHALWCAGRLMLRSGDRLLPGPLTRRDRGSEHAGLHHRLLARAISAAAPRPSTDPVVHVRTLGQAGLARLPGEEPIDSTPRVVELLAFLVARGGASPIDDVREALLPNSAGTALLHRAAREANRLLPAGVGIRLTSSGLEVDPPGALVSDDEEALRLAGVAALGHGAQAAPLPCSVLRLAAAEPFLPGVEADWVRARRDDVARAAADHLAAASTRADGAPERRSRPPATS